MNEALLLNILCKAVRGAECYTTRDRRITTLREFQLLVDTAQDARGEGLIDASFQLPSKGKMSAGLIRTFTVLGITPVGVERLSQLSGQAGSAPAPVIRLSAASATSSEGRPAPWSA